MPALLPNTEARDKQSDGLLPRGLTMQLKFVNGGGHIRSHTETSRTEDSTGAEREGRSFVPVMNTQGSEA